MIANSASTNDLSMWQRTLAAVAGDLAALDSDSVYQELEHGIVGASPYLTGSSFDAAKQVVHEVQTLFRQYSLLYDRLDRTIKAQGSLRGRLVGPSEDLLARAIPLQADDVLAEELPDLMDQSARAFALVYPLPVIPSRLLAALAPAIARAQLGVDRFRTARADLAAISSQAAFEMKTAAENAQRLGIDPMDDLRGLKEALNRLQADAGADPLNAADNYRRSVLPLLAQLADAINAIVAEKNEADRTIRGARETLQQLERDHRQATEGLAEAQRKVVMDCSALLPISVSDAQLADFGQWLDRLENLHSTGRWRAASKPLMKWIDTVLPLAKAEAMAAEANYGPLARLALLRGRLQQLRVVANGRYGIIALPGTPAHEAAETYEAAVRALTRSREQPRIDLGVASDLVDRYAALVDPPHRSVV